MLRGFLEEGLAYSACEPLRQAPLKDIWSLSHVCFLPVQVLWKCSVALVLCEAYILPHHSCGHHTYHTLYPIHVAVVTLLNPCVHTQLRMLQLDSSDSVLLQIHFHTLLLQSVAGELIVNMSNAEPVSSVHTWTSWTCGKLRCSLHVSCMTVFGMWRCSTSTSGCCGRPLSKGCRFLSEGGRWWVGLWNPKILIWQLHKVTVQFSSYWLVCAEVCFVIKGPWDSLPLLAQDQVHVPHYLVFTRRWCFVWMCVNYMPMETWHWISFCDIKYVGHEMCVWEEVMCNFQETNLASNLLPCVYIYSYIWWCNIGLTLVNIYPVPSVGRKWPWSPEHPMMEKFKVQF